MRAAKVCRCNTKQGTGRARLQPLRALPVQFSFGSVARSPSDKAKFCKSFIGGSIPPRASKVFLRNCIFPFETAPLAYANLSPHPSPCPKPFVFLSRSFLLTMG